MAEVFSLYCFVCSHFTIHDCSMEIGIAWVGRTPENAPYVKAPVTARFICKTCGQSNSTTGLQRQAIAEAVMKSDIPGIGFTPRDVFNRRVACQCDPSDGYVCVYHS